MSRPELYKECDGFKLPYQFSEINYRQLVSWTPAEGTRFVVTYPKCGTTWTQMIIGLILTDGQEPSENGIMEVTHNQPFLEFTGTEGVVPENGGPGFPVYKTHLPYELQPGTKTGSRFLYVIRNPKDTLVSFYHHYRNMHMEYRLDFDYFFEAFQTGHVCYGDYYDHLLGWWEASKRDPNHITLLVYEDMKRDPEEAIRKIAAWLGPDEADKLERDPEMVQRIKKFSSIEYMKTMTDPASMMGPMCEMVLKGPGPGQNSEGPPPPPGVLRTMKGFAETYLKMKEDLKSGRVQKGNFIRNGQVNDWKNHFTPQQDRAMKEKFNLGVDLHGIDSIWSDLNWL